MNLTEFLPMTKEEFQWEGTKYGVVSLNDEIPAIKTVLSVVHTVTTTILIVILLIVTLQHILEQVIFLIIIMVVLFIGME